MTALLAAIPSPTRNVIEIGPLTVYFYGILIAIGVIVAVVVAKQRYVRFGGDGELVERIAIWAVVLGFLGARMAYVSTHMYRFSGRPWAIFFIWEGGLALYGGLTVGTLTALYLLRKWDGDVWAFADATAVGIPLAQAIGRWGNYFNQELFGTPTTLPWGLEIAPANRPPQFAEFATFHPTFLYESLWNLLLTVPIILWLERKGKLAKGSSFAVYLMVYGTGRFLMELLRTDTSFRLLGISRNGWVSLVVVVGAAIGFRWLQRRAEPRTLVGPPTFLAPGAPTVAEAAGEDGAPAEEGTRPAEDESAEQSPSEEPTPEP